MTEDLARPEAGRNPRRSSRLVNAIDRPLSWQTAAATAVALLAVVFATNNWRSWGAGLTLVSGNDERAYLRIARAAPSLPSSRLPEQHAQRWPVHWLIGVIAQLLGVSVESLYHVLVIVCIAAVVAVLIALLMCTRVPAGLGVLCLAAFVLNPYNLRYYLLAPGYLADLVFECGLGLTLLGLIRPRVWLVMVGSLVAVIARQTMLPVLPVVAVWAGLVCAPRGGSVLRRVSTGVAVFAFAAVAWGVADVVARPFSEKGYPIGRLTILDELRRLPGTAHPLISQFAHVAIAMLLVGGLIAAVLWRSRGRGLGGAFWGALVTAVVIVAQAALLNPDPIANNYYSSNEPRLTAMALIPLVLALAIGGERVVSAARPGTALRAGAAIAVALAIGSLHPDFTYLAPSSAGQTLVLQVVVAVIVCVAVFVAADTARPGVPADSVRVRQT